MHGDVQGVTNAGLISREPKHARPIRLVRHAGHGTWDDTARSALALSKMNWNNDALYDPLPVRWGTRRCLHELSSECRAWDPSLISFAFLCSVNFCPMDDSLVSWTHNWETGLRAGAGAAHDHARRADRGEITAR